MLREIFVEDWNLIEDLVDEYLITYTDDKGKRKRLRESLRSKMKSGEILVLAGFDLENSPVGFCSFKVDMKRLTMIHARNGHWKKLLEDSITHFKKSYSSLYIMAQFFPEHLYDTFTSNGFVKYDRKLMSISREEIQDLPPSKFPNSFSLVPFDTSNEKTAVTTLYECHRDSSSLELFQDFYGSIDGCRETLAQWNRYSETYLLMDDSEPIGICVYNTLKNRGYISFIGLMPPYRGRGLGRLLLIDILKGIIREHKSIANVWLDVIIDEPNIAFRMYKHVGFKTSTSYPIYVWHRQDHNS